MFTYRNVVKTLAITCSQWILTANGVTNSAEFNKHESTKEVDAIYDEINHNDGIARNNEIAQNFEASYHEIIQLSDVAYDE